MDKNGADRMLARIDASKALRFFCLMGGLAVGSGEGSAAAAAQIDLELVLAVDVSESMSRAELTAQRSGYVAALRHPDFAAALAMRSGVTISYVEWAGPNDQRVVVPWTVVSNAATAEQLAGRLEAAPLHPHFDSPPWNTGTSISQALLFAAGMFASPYASRVIDISGDGPNNAGPFLDSVRDRVIALGIVVNGLPIPASDGQNSPFPLETYYEDCVIGGPGSFVLAVNTPDEFATAIRRKMILEIAGALPRLIRAGYALETEPRLNCAAAERAVRPASG
jgi:hypothetical protein